MPIPDKPCLHGQYRAWQLDGEFTAFVGPLGPVVLAGPYPGLVPLLDGSRTLEELAGQSGLGFSDVVVALDMLEREGLVIDWRGASPGEAGQPAYARQDGGPRGSGPDGGTPVFFCTDELVPEVAAHAEAARTPWTLVTVNDTHAALGPRFTPGAEPGYVAFAARRREIRAFAEWVPGHATECSPARRVAEGAARAHALAALPRFQAQAQPGEIWVLDLACGEWSTHRMGDLVSGYTGIIARVQDYHAELAPGAVCAFAEHLFPPDASRQDAAWRGFRRRSSGKGATLDAARTSARMEAIERYCGAWHGDERVRRASRRALGERAIAPEVCMGFSSRQYGERERTNPSAITQAWVPRASDRDEIMDWVAAGDRYVPASFVYYGYPGPASTEKVCVADSNGCAAGESLDDAVERGWLELAERDAVGIWWFHRVRRPAPAVDIASATERYRSLGRELSLLDVTNDLGVPVVVALSWERESGACATVGFGSHWTLEQAAQRAIAEMDQFLPEALEGASSRVSGADPLRDAYLHPDATAKAAPAFSTRPAEGIVVVNQTRLDIGVPVVKVIAPWLCHFWPRFGRARLYDVPVQMGWREIACAEECLNPARLLL